MSKLIDINLLKIGSDEINEFLKMVQMPIDAPDSVVLFAAALEAISSAGYAVIKLCERCMGEGWVCEAHRERPWNDDLKTGCTCGAGEPCPDCNICDRNHPPRMPPGSKVIYDKDGWRH